MPSVGHGILGAVLFAVGATGCTPSIPDCALHLSNPPLSEFVMVEYVPEALAADPPPDIRGTPRYEAARAGVKYVTFRVPDACLEPPESSNPPKANSAVPPRPLTLYPVCLDWVGELERAFSTSNVTVLPWDDLLQLERTKNLTTFAAGKELGADVVFFLNKIQAYYIRRHRPSGDELQAFASDESGHSLGPLTVGPDTSLAMRAFIDDLVGDANGAQTVLDVTAVTPETGDAIWYYRRVQSSPLGDVHPVKFLFGKLGDGPWTSIAPTFERSRRLESAGSIRRGRGALIVADVQLRQGAEDFVQAFQGGK